MNEILTSAIAVKIIRKISGETANSLKKKAKAKITFTDLYKIESGEIQMGIKRAKELGRILDINPAVFIFPTFDELIKAIIKIKV